VTPSFLAAAEKLPSSAKVTNNDIASKRSIGSTIMLLQGGRPPFASNRLLNVDASAPALSRRTHGAKWLANTKRSSRWAPI
jgi:hypothetical protein